MKYLAFIIIILSVSCQSANKDCLYFKNQTKDTIIIDYVAFTDNYLITSEMSFNDTVRDKYTWDKMLINPIGCSTCKVKITDRNKVNITIPPMDSIMTTMHYNPYNLSETPLIGETKISDKSGLNKKSVLPLFLNLSSYIRGSITISINNTFMNDDYLIDSIIIEDYPKFFKQIKVLLNDTVVIQEIGKSNYKKEEDKLRMFIDYYYKQHIFRQIDSVKIIQKTDSSRLWEHF